MGHTAGQLNLSKTVQYDWTDYIFRITQDGCCPSSECGKPVPFALAGRGKDSSLFEKTGALETGHDVATSVNAARQTLIPQQAEWKLLISHSEQGAGPSWSSRTLPVHNRLWMLKDEQLAQGWTAPAKGGPSCDTSAAQFSCTAPTEWKPAWDQAFEEGSASLLGSSPFGMHYWSFSLQTTLHGEAGADVSDQNPVVPKHSPSPTHKARIQQEQETVTEHFTTTTKDSVPEMDKGSGRLFSSFTPKTGLPRPE